MIVDLPPEILLQILSYLAIADLSRLKCTSRRWSSFLVEYESTIYRQAAFLHGYISDPTALLDSKEISERYSRKQLEGFGTWRELCQKRIYIGNAWNGLGPSTIKSLSTQQDDPIAVLTSVHRIKVDERRGLVITTSTKGGLFVADMSSGDVLWMLGASYVRACAHLEYSNGFLIFDRMTGDKEVWRLIDDRRRQELHPPNFECMSNIDAAQRENYGNARKRASQAASSLYTSTHGCFEPYALLRMPLRTTAYRFVYPTLLVGSRERVYLWDVPTARVVEVVEGIQSAVPKNVRHKDSGSGLEAEPEESGDESTTVNDEDDDETDLLTDMADEDRVFINMPQLGDFRYLDHSSSHIFLAGQFILKIFKRATAPEPAGSTSSSSVNSSDLVLQIQGTKLRYGRWKYTLKPHTWMRDDYSPFERRQVIISEREKADTKLDRRLVDGFVAVHVSPCGLHFAALLGGSRLLIVPHFQQLTGATLYNNILDVQLGSPHSSSSVYLAYEAGDGDEGRIGVVTTGGVFIITVPRFHYPFKTEVAPIIRITRVWKAFTNPSWLDAVTSIMLSDTGVFLNWNPTGVQNSMPVDINDYFEEERRRRDALMKEWEDSFEFGLGDLERLGEECYERLGNGDMLVSPEFTVHRSYISVVHHIDMLQ